MQVALTPADTNLRELAKIALVEPVILQQEEEDVAVIVSAKEYKRLTKADWDDFDQFRNRISAIAQSNGLTEQKLDDLLKEIDAETPR